MARHDEHGVVSRARRGQLARLARRLAGELLRGDMDANVYVGGALTDAEDAIVRASIRRLAERLIRQGDRS